MGTLFRQLQRFLAERSRVAPSFGLSCLAVILISAFTYWRLIDSRLFAHLFDSGSEGLNSVQAWVNHGFWSMVGMFPWGQGYLPAGVPPEHIYQSKTPLHLFPLWLGYMLAGSQGFPAFKVVYSLGLVSINGLLLAGIARLCFPLRGHNWQSPIPGSLVFVCTYVITISNEAMLRFCLIDEPDYLGLTFWLATVLSLGLWADRSTDGQETTSQLDAALRPRLAMALGFLTSWIYPILGVVNLITLFLLQLFPLAARLRKGLRSLIPGAVVGIGLYWIQRTAAKLLIPEKLFGSDLMYRMGMTSRHEKYDGVLDTLNLVFDQRSGGIPGGLSHSQIYHENTAVWIIGLVLFIVVLARLGGVDRKVLLVLAAGESWLLIPLLSQSVSQHGWVYAIHFMPSVVLGWIGALTILLPGHRSTLFAPGMLIFFSLLIWAIQLRWFLLAYLG